MSSISPPLCSCGTFAVGMCVDCQQYFCAGCSSVVLDGKRRCRACASPVIQAIEARQINLALQIEENAAIEQEKRDERYKVLPEMGVQELAAYYAGSTKDGATHRVSSVSGSDIVSALQAGHIKAILCYSRKLRFGRYRQIHGWFVENRWESSGDFDSRSGTVDVFKEFIATNGTLYRFEDNYRASTLTKLAERDTIHPVRTIHRIREQLEIERLYNRSR